MINIMSLAQVHGKERVMSIADCSGAVDVIHFKESNIQFSGEAGYLDELGQFSSDKMEINSVWLKFEPRLNGEFEFTLTPESNFDFQYYLFKDNSGDFCANDFDYIKVEKLISTDSLLFSGKDVEVKNERKLVGPFDCKIDDVFYLLLHSREEHKKKVKIQYKLKGDFEETEEEIQDFRRVKTNIAFQIKIRDKYTHENVLSNITTKGIGYDNILFLGSNFIFDARNGRGQKIMVNAKGYFLYTADLKIDYTKDSEFIVELEPLAVGKKLQLNELKFSQNTSDFLPTSYIELKRLLDFMILNSETKIEIIGHVNAPGFKNDGKVMKLSEQRAKMAYLYLIDHGVSKNRVKYTGKGNLEMIYPTPRTNEEEEANRRVEILILE